MFSQGGMMTIITNYFFSGHVWEGASICWNIFWCLMWGNSHRLKTHSGSSKFNCLFSISQGPSKAKHDKTFGCNPHLISICLFTVCKIFLVDRARLSCYRNPGPNHWSPVLPIWQALNHTQTRLCSVFVLKHRILFHLIFAFTSLWCFRAHKHLERLLTLFEFEHFFSLDGKNRDI